MAAMAFGGLAGRRPDQYQRPRGGLLPAPQQNIVVGRFVVVAGPSGGIFVYSGPPTKGNLVASVTGNGGPNDGHGNPYFAGITTYAPGIAYAGLAEGTLLLGSLNPATLTEAGTISFEDDATAASEQPSMLIAAPFISPGGPFPGIELFGQSGDATKPPQVVLAVLPGTIAPITSFGVEVQANPGDTSQGGLMVRDTGTGRVASAQLFEVQDHASNPICSVPPAGGFAVYGDLVRSLNGVFGPVGAYLTPWGAVMPGGSEGGTPSLYGGTGAPLPAAITSALTTYSKFAVEGDQYFRSDTPAVANQRIYICTASGTLAAPNGTWAGIV
jgi:hypothetical protein